MGIRSVADAEFSERLIALAQLPADQLPQTALRLARFSLLDWMACGLAGVSEPVAIKMRDLATQEAGAEIASVFGAGRVPARMAALVNGATSHALDYDDTHFAHVGHLSVGIYPAALAIGEQMDAAAEEVIAAFLIGAEAAIRLGCVLGQAHYDLGFHQTATAGAFGATLAAARLLHLDARQTRHALGLCATRASGIKSQFGTMGKPYNAGLAASNGVECAALAGLGMTSADDGILGAQGFVATHAPVANADETSKRFLFEDNKYKLHACCHGTHAMIEALAAAPLPQDLSQVASVKLRTNPRWLKVCDLKSPRTGLEVKFSYAWLAGMVLRGDATQDEATFTDALAADDALTAFGACVDVVGDASLSDLQARGTVTLRDGREVAISFDLETPMSHDVLKQKLWTKAQALIGAKAPAVWEFADPTGKTARQIGEVIRAV